MFALQELLAGSRRFQAHGINQGPQRGAGTFPIMAEGRNPSLEGGEGWAGAPEQGGCSIPAVPQARLDTGLGHPGGVPMAGVALRGLGSLPAQSGVLG